VLAQGVQATPTPTRVMYSRFLPSVRARRLWCARFSSCTPRSLGAQC
jgi:hypothetical protein